MKKTTEIGGREVMLYAQDEAPQMLLIQTLGQHERGSIDKEVEMITKASDTPFAMAAFAIGDWEAELTPWHDPAISRRNEVGEHALDTLDYVTQTLVPHLRANYGQLPIVLGGYSLGGLFSRWAASKSECFEAVACCSPSLWIAAWREFSDAHDIMARYVYLSLGDREEFSKNKAIMQVGDNIRWEYQHLIQVVGEDHCTLQWNKGNHFQDGAMRMAKGFAWCVNKLAIENQKKQ